MNLYRIESTLHTKGRWDDYFKGYVVAEDIPEAVIKFKKHLDKIEGEVTEITIDLTNIVNMTPSNSNRFIVI